MERSVKLNDIRIDGGTQTRAEINNSTVDEYAIDMQEGAKFPPVILFNDGAHLWLADGFHRFHASNKCGFLDILGDVRTGTRADAIKYALGANRANGMRRTNADKRRCVEIALKEFGKLSDRAIEELCGVSDSLVASVRKCRVPENGTEPKTRIGRDGVAQPAHKPKKQATPIISEPPSVQEPDPVLDEEYYPEDATPETATKSSAFDWADGYANSAIEQLKRISPDDPQRVVAAKKVIRWINENMLTQTK